MEEVLLLKCGELVLKGLNRGKFEERLLVNLRRRLKKIGSFEVYALQSTVYVFPKEGASIEDALKAAKNVFGIASISKAAVCRKEFDEILSVAGDYLSEALKKTHTFKVEAKRSDKSFPLTSPQICVEAGAYLLEKFPHLEVDVQNPELRVYIEIRDRDAFVHAERIPGAGGMPVGSNGHALLLLSGGIDSPVAGHMIAKRGVSLSALHFESYPYTSEQAKQKVLSLAKIMTDHVGHMKVYIASFTKIQEEIRKSCPEDMFTLIMRRFMMRIAQKIAERDEALAVITGESLGQVASQTMESLRVTESVCDLPVLRPLIGMDKEEIVQIARKIGTFETSILPYEDCCTVFTPKHPKTKPKLDEIEEAERVLPVEELVSQALESVQTVEIR